MLIPCTNPISSDMFHWHKEDNTFSQEISTLQGNIPLFDPFRRIYDDACDAGFHLESARTGQVITFYHDTTDKDDEGDVAGWWFKVIPEHVHKNPRLAKVRVLIIND